MSLVDRFPFTGFSGRILCPGSRRKGVNGISSPQPSISAWKQHGYQPMILSKKTSPATANSHTMWARPHPNIHQGLLSRSFSLLHSPLLSWHLNGTLSKPPKSPCINYTLNSHPAGPNRSPRCCLSHRCREGGRSTGEGWKEGGLSTEPEGGRRKRKPQPTCCSHHSPFSQRPPNPASPPLFNKPYPQRPNPQGRFGEMGGDRHTLERLEEEAGFRGRCGEVVWGGAVI